MTRTLDMICKCRDILTEKDLPRLRGYTGNGNLFDQTIKAIQIQMDKKAEDYSRNLDFTSQDLIEFAEDIQAVLKRWETHLNPAKNIKALLKTVKDGKLSLIGFCESATNIMAFRRDTIECLIRTLSILEYFAVYLYFLEEASNDRFALTHTKRY